MGTSYLYNVGIQKFSTSGAPILDIDDGVRIGDIAVDASNKTIYKCDDNASGAPIWSTYFSGSWNDLDNVPSAVDNLTQDVIDDSHTHSNSAIIDSLTQDVIDDSHTHSNSAIIDSLTQDVIDNEHSHTNQAILDSLTQDVLDDSHTHANQSIIDSLTQDVIDNEHTHSNKTIIDQLTQDVIDDTHSHTNQAILDNLTQDVLDDSHTHANKTIIDSLTQSVIDNEHTHANQSIIDQLTQSVIDNEHTHANKSILDAASASYTTTEETKLSNIDENANNYTHPVSHSASMITTDNQHLFVSDSEKSLWDSKADGTHYHAGSDITSGTLNALRMPTSGTWNLQADLTLSANGKYYHYDYSTGYFGLGTSSPDYMVDIHHATRADIRCYDTTNDVGVALIAESGTAYVGSTTSDDLKIMVGGSVKATLTTDGDFGVGTSSPDARCEISDTSNTELRITNTGATDHSARIQQTDSGTWIGGYDSTNTIKMAFRAYGDSYLLGGYYGVGTDNPQYKIHAYDTGSSTRPYVMSETSSTGSYAGYQIKTPGGAGVVYMAGTDGVIRLRADDYILCEENLSVAGTVYADDYRASSNTSVGASATTIAISIGLCMVRGADGGGNNFTDLVITAEDGSSPNVVATDTQGSPAARSYTVLSNSLRLAMSSGTYTIHAVNVR